ncbi:type VII secretion system-associated protein [Streptomyces sp. NPDC054775]
MTETDMPESSLTSIAESDWPEVPEDIRRAALLAPDHWFWMVDPSWTGEGAPPEWAMIGRWRSGLDGGVEEWEQNQQYRPSPLALNWPEPENLLESAVQLACTGYADISTVIDALKDHPIAVPTGPLHIPLITTTPNGVDVVPVFTSEGPLRAVPGVTYRIVSAAELVLSLTGCEHILIHLGDTLRLQLDSRSIVASIEGESKMDAVRDGDSTAENGQYEQTFLPEYSPGTPTSKTSHTEGEASDVNPFASVRDSSSETSHFISSPSSQH